MSSPTQFKDLIMGEKPVLVDFYAHWCAPCKMMTPILEEVSSIIGNQLKIIKVDVDKNPKLATSLKIQGVPTLVLYHKGHIIWRQSGVIQAPQLAQIIHSQMKKVTA